MCVCVYFRFFSLIGYYKILNTVPTTSLFSLVMLTCFPITLKNLGLLYEQVKKKVAILVFFFS